MEPTKSKTQKFAVLSVNKDGTVSRMRKTRADWQLNVLPTRDAAESRVRYLEEKNPGRRFTIAVQEAS